MSKTPITMTPGDDTHLTLLMSPVSLNFVTGQDREHLLAFGRAAFEAGQRCQGCAVQQGYVPVETLSAEIKEPAQIKPSMSMHVSAEDYQRALTEWQAEQKQSETPQELIARFRSLPVDHKPDGWPAVQTKEITALLDHITALEAQLAAVQQGVQPPFMYAIADGYGQPFFEEQGCVSSEAKDLQPEVDSLNQNLDGEPPYKVVALYTHPTQQGLDAQALKQSFREYLSVSEHIDAGGHAMDSIATDLTRIVLAEKEVSAVIARRVHCNTSGQSGEDAENIRAAAQAKQGERP